MTPPWRLRRVRRFALALVVGITIVSAACTLPEDAQPREIAADRVPFNLLEPGTPTSIPPRPQHGPTLQAKLYFLEGDRLRSVTREVPNASPSAMLELLVRGPTEMEAARGLRSAIPAGTKALMVGRDDQTVELALSEEINDVQGPQQKNAFAQIVYTVTALEGITAARFRVDERRVPVPTDQGNVDTAVGRADYLTVRPIEGTD